MRSIVLLICILIQLSQFCVFADEAPAFGDDLMSEHSFVIRGVMSKKWNGKLRFAVCDPIKNKGHELIADKNGRFNMTVPMRGMMQEMYLYVGDAVTIPVCASDTINLVLEDDDMQLTARDQKVNMDFKLAEMLYNKMRKRYIDINRTFNNYYKASGYGRRSTVESDSIMERLIEKIDDYHIRYKGLIDAFVAEQGHPRSEEYFRIKGYYEPLHFIVDKRELNRISSNGYISDAFPDVEYDFFQESWLKYPSYSRFMIDYLNNTVYKVNNAFEKYKGFDAFKNMVDMSRHISPDGFLEELLEVRNIMIEVRSAPSGDLRKKILYVYEGVKNAALRKELESVLSGVGRISPGCKAPSLVMRSANGKKVTLNDFRGKYVYLDFWDFGCSVCMNEFAVLPKLKEHYAGRMEDVEFVTVCASSPTKSQLEEFAKKHNMDGVNLIFDADKSDKVYDAGVFPTYILIDPKGDIVEFFTDRPSAILSRAAENKPSAFDKALRPL